MSSTPADPSSCYRSSSSHLCPNIFHLDRRLIDGTDLELFVQPNKLLISGLSNVSYYQSLLQQITIQVDDVDEILTRNLDFRVRVYVTDQNGVSLSSRTVPIRVMDSTFFRRKRDLGSDDDDDGDETVSKDNKHGLSLVLSGILIVTVLICVFMLLSFYLQHL